MNDSNTQSEIDRDLKEMKREREKELMKDTENHGVSESELHDELLTQGDYFYEALNTNEVHEKWKSVACLPVCELSEDSANKLLVDYAITANRWINTVCKVMTEIMGEEE